MYKKGFKKCTARSYIDNVFPMIFSCSFCSKQAISSLNDFKFCRQTL